LGGLATQRRGVRKRFPDCGRFPDGREQREIREKEIKERRLCGQSLF